MQKRAAHTHSYAVPLFTALCCAMCRCAVLWLWLCGGELRLYSHLAGEELLAALQPPGKVEISDEPCENIALLHCIIIMNFYIILRNVPVAAQNAATTWMAARSMSWQKAQIVVSAQ